MHIGRVGSVAITVSISIERYYCVCHKKTNNCVSYALLPTSIAFSIIFNIPKFFELMPCLEGTKQDNQNKSYEGFSNHLNNTTMDIGEEYLLQSTNESQLCDPNGIQATPLRNDFLYIIFYTVLSKLFLVEIIPWITVISLNYYTWKQVKQFNTARERTLGCSNARGKLNKTSIDIISYTSKLKKSLLQHSMHSTLF